MLIDPFVVRAGLCSCNGMLKSDPVAPVFLIQVKVTCLIINTRCYFPVFIDTFFFNYGKYMHVCFYKAVANFNHNSLMNCVMVPTPYWVKNLQY